MIVISFTNHHNFQLALKSFLIKELKFTEIVLLFLLFVHPLRGQNTGENRLSREIDYVTITGRVIDLNNHPITGATIVPVIEKPVSAEEKALAARLSDYTQITDSDGRYSISIPENPNLILVFRYVGMMEERIPVNGRTTVDACLVEDVIKVDAVVVTGIFTRKAESYTGAVKTISSAQIEAVNNQNVFEALKNLDPALVVLENLEQGSNPNRIANLQLRGATALGATKSNLKSNFIDDPNMPLFILDGFETTSEKIMDMDMNRIESITVLKDASAKAIYGSKAGNGVIVIETKELKSNETLISYTGSMSLEMPDLSSYNLCDALEKLEIERREGYYEDAFDSAQLVEHLKLYNKRLKKALEGESTYWLSKPLHLGVGNKHSLSVELGTKDIKTTTGFSYNDVQGVMRGSDRKTISGSTNLSYRRKKWLFRNIMTVTSMKSNESPYGNFNTYTQLNPYESPYNAEKQLRRYLDNTFDGRITGNPLYDAALNMKLSTKYLDFTDNFYAEYHVLDFLKLVARIGVNTKKTTMEDFYPAGHSKFFHSYTSIDDDAKLSAGSFNATNGSSTTLSGDFSAQMNKSFDGGHNLFATAQYSLSEQKYSEVTHYTTGFPNSRMDNIIFARQYAADATPTGNSGLNRNIGAMVTAGYSYRDRYMLDATFHANASSVFGTNNRWALFWSAGLAWNVHKEKFMQNVDWIEQLKIRGSTGSSGNQNYATSNSIAIFTYYNDKFYNGFTGVRLNNMENPFLSWEQTFDYDLGFDLRTKHFSVTFDAYIADTKNLIFNRSLLSSTGFSSFSDNMGMVRNKGMELSVSYRVYSGRNGFINLNGNIALNDNRIRKISDALATYNKQQQENAVVNRSTRPVIQYYDGCAVNAIWAVQSLGIDPVSGREIFLDLNGDITDRWNASNLVYCGSADPKYNGNFGFNAEFHHFGLNVVCTCYGGGHRYNSTLVDKVENVYIGNNVDRRIYSDRWYYKGQTASFRNGYKDGNTFATTRFVQKNNVLSLSSVSAYYEFPVKLIEKLKLSRLQLKVYANDLATFSTIQIERGTFYPYARTLSFSLSATF